MVSGVVDWKSYNAMTWSITELFGRLEGGVALPLFALAFSLVGVVVVLFTELDEVEWASGVSLFALLVLFKGEAICLSFEILFEDDDVFKGDAEGGGVVILVDCPLFKKNFFYIGLIF